MLMKIHDFDDSFRTLETLRRGMSRFLWDDGLFGGLPAEPEVLHRALDIRETEESFVLRAELPGLSDNDVQITVDGGIVDIRAERKAAVPAGYKVRHAERASFTFSRRVRLPSSVDEDNAQAVLKDGVLTLTLTKQPQKKPRTIQVQAG
jgi:HSP20 family protein